VSIAPIEREWQYNSFDNCPKLSPASQTALEEAGYTGGF
jgi:hypothetical protein